MKFAQGDKISYTNSVTGETRTGTVLRSESLKDWQGQVLVEEVLSITWDDGSVDHAWSIEDVTKVTDADLDRKEP